MATAPGRAASPTAAYDLPLRVSARTDYAIRALTGIAASDGRPITAQRISRAQAIPPRFLLSTVLGSVTLADVARGTLPRAVQVLAGQPDPAPESASP